MRQGNFFPVVLTDEFDGILKHGHHAQTEQIHFDDAHVGAIFLVPLHDHAAGHGGRLERNYGIELPLANHHASGVLAEVPRHVLRGEGKLVIFAQAWVIKIEPSIAESAVEFVVLIAEFPGGNRGGNFVQSFRIELQRLAHFPCGHAIAISNDIGSHGCAALAVAPVDILNDFFTLVAARQVDTDVRPLAALFGKEAFEEQFHADGINRRDSQRIANFAIRG